MLYTKPIEEITFDDVETFCKAQMAENAYLDYKRDFPRNLEKTLSAFANTFGGMVLIGVEGDDSNKPILPITGIAFQKGLSEKVTNIILGNITPPFFPEIQVCQDSESSKTVVVIRVAESNMTPHAIMKNTQVYYRTGDVNNPEEIATVDRIGWLVDRRKKSELLKGQLIEESRERFELSRERSGIDDGYKAITEIIVTPSYPRKPFLNPPDLRGVVPRLAISDYSTGGGYPRVGQGLRLFQNGVCAMNLDPSNNWVSIFELNTFGQIIARENFSYSDEEGRYFQFDGFVDRICCILQIAATLYEEISYWGHLELSCSIENLKGLTHISRANPQGFTSRLGGSHSASRDSVGFARQYTYSQLRDEALVLAKDCCGSIGYEFNIADPDPMIEKIFKQRNS